MDQVTSEIVTLANGRESNQDFRIARIYKHSKNNFFRLYKRSYMFNTKSKVTFPDILVDLLRR